VSFLLPIVPPPRRCSWNAGTTLRKEEREGRAGREEEREGGRAKQIKREGRKGEGERGREQEEDSSLFKNNTGMFGTAQGAPFT
jgi:hypothetical protein